MTTLDPNGGYVVLVIPFTVESDIADMTFAELFDGTKRAMRPRLDFVSADRHASNGRKHISNYVRSRSQADTGATMADATAHAHMKHAAEIATAFEPIPCRLRDSVTV